VTRVIPHSIEAERTVLGCAMWSGDACSLVAEFIDPSDFYRPIHQSIASAIVELHGSGQPVDAGTVAERLRALGLLEHCGGLSELTSLVAEAGPTGSVTTLIGLIAEYAVRRRLLAAMADLDAAAYDLAVPVETLAERLLAVEQEFACPTRTTHSDQTAPDFVAGDHDYDWLVSGLIERGDRFIFTGAEGYGKSTLLRQLAVQFAAGVHPWTAEYIPPISVLMIDLENSAAQTARKLRGLLTEAQRLRQLSFGHPDVGSVDNLRINVHPQGLDLLTSRDRSWLTDRLRANRPVDLLVISPLYKLHAGSPTDEEPAAQVARFLDLLRERYGCALMIEAHSPHADDGRGRTVRPYGASLWMRWPEFGYGLRPTKDDPLVSDLVAWRGPRDGARDWPFTLRRGSHWPWEAANSRKAAGPELEQW
jgi:replicative DNA helicase